LRPAFLAQQEIVGVKVIPETTPATMIDFTLPAHHSRTDSHAKISLSEPRGMKYVAIRGPLKDVSRRRPLKGTMRQFGILIIALMSPPEFLFFGRTKCRKTLDRNSTGGCPIHQKLKW
jgi:hypothetical protein